MIAWQRWMVIDPEGRIRSRHVLYQTAFWTARGLSLAEGGGMWLVRKRR